MKYVYPEGCSYEKYESTLTEEDIQQLLNNDYERLTRLHGHD